MTIETRFNIGQPVLLFYKNKLYGSTIKGVLISEEETQYELSVCNELGKPKKESETMFVGFGSKVFYDQQFIFTDINHFSKSMHDYIDKLDNNFKQQNG